MTQLRPIIRAMRVLLVTFLFASAVSAPLQARAEQRLIPSPYPSGSDSAYIILAPRPSRHQMLIPTPYPRKLGPNAAGNPRITQPRRHQRLVPAPYPRQYR
jgi:hypothetical protein